MRFHNEKEATTYYTFIFLWSNILQDADLGRAFSVRTTGILILSSLLWGYGLFPRAVWNISFNWLFACEYKIWAKPLVYSMYCCF